MIKKPNIPIPKNLSQIQGYIAIFLFLVSIVGYFINEHNKAIAKAIADDRFHQQMEQVILNQNELIKYNKENDLKWNSYQIFYGKVVEYIDISSHH